ncbi:hypothetical protein RRG08_046458 [Elysia crispata]|uniref:Uncharacterized protein n=1 Tax=Elysia crispata TaxID=231223 RepID=A0AAE0YIB6_9GAST|nr:hypothetical protein RRG08_046458 [Elysia crispata]
MTTGFSSGKTSLPMEAGTISTINVYSPCAWHDLGGSELRDTQHYTQLKEERSSPQTHPGRPGCQLHSGIKGSDTGRGKKSGSGGEMICASAGGRLYGSDGRRICA